MRTPLTGRGGEQDQIGSLIVFPAPASFNTDPRGVLRRLLNASPEARAGYWILYRAIRRDAGMRGAP